MDIVPGDLVQYKVDPGRFATVINITRTSRGSTVLEVVVVYDKNYPDSVGEKKYAHYDYLTKITRTT